MNDFTIPYKKIYAIIIYYTFSSMEKNEKHIAIFYTKKAYEKWTDIDDEIMLESGLCWSPIFINKKK